LCLCLCLFLCLSSPELFRPPELHAVPSPEPHEGAPLTLRCQTEMYPWKSASRLLFSFLKDGRTLRDRDPRQELHLPEAREGDSGLYWCQATPEGSSVQKQSPRLEVRVLAPVSQPLLTLSPGPTGLAVGDVVQLFCVALKGSPPILYSFYLDGKMLGSPQAPRGRTASFSFTVMSARDAGSYFCQAQNNVSKETSEPKTFSLDGSSPGWLPGCVQACWPRWPSPRHFWAASDPGDSPVSNRSDFLSGRTA
uniref:Ig-like domain-containing protein n=1 Tax=Canis lupus dingo TaxID=286419 RepID=A0A8C0L5Q4_CANLU